MQEEAWQQTKETTFQHSKRLKTKKIRSVITKSKQKMQSSLTVFSMIIYLMIQTFNNNRKKMRTWLYRITFVMVVCLTKTFCNIFVYHNSTQTKILRLLRKIFWKIKMTKHLKKRKKKQKERELKTEESLMKTLLITKLFWKKDQWVTWKL